MIDNRTEKRKTGDEGEDIAARFYAQSGYRIAARNFACKMGEIDIVAVDDKRKIIAFVEVKSRNTTKYGLPCEAVNYRKQRRLFNTAEYFMLSHRGFGQYRMRMDIFEILRKDGKVYVRQLKNAFGKEY